MLRLFRRSGLASLAAAFASLVSAAAATPLTTPINPTSAGGGERCLWAAATCVGGAYNGKSSIIGLIEQDLKATYGGGVSLARVDDGLDQVWRNLGGGAALARARYAGYDNLLGVMLDEATIPGSRTVPIATGIVSGDTDTYAPATGFRTVAQPLTNKKVYLDNKSSLAFAPGETTSDLVDYPGGDTTGDWITLPLLVAEQFQLVIGRQSGANVIGAVSSVMANNPHGVDQMVAWRLMGLPEPHYVVAFEDLTAAAPGQKPGDWDYNDLVFELRLVRNGPPGGGFEVAVAEPPALAVLLVGLLSFTGLRRRARAQVRA